MIDHSKFKEIENKYIELKSSLDSGSISSEELKLKLKKMMLRDDDGNYWMIGSNTGKWYIYNGTDWKEKDPYSGADLSKTQNFSNVGNETVVIHQEENEESNEIFLEKKEDTFEHKEEEIIIDNESSEKKSFEAEEIIKEEEIEKEVESIEVQEEKTFTDPVAANGDLTVHCIICKSRIDNHSVYCSYCGANQKELSSKKTKSGEELLIRSVNITSLVFFFGGLGLIAGVIFGATFGIFEIFNDLLAKFPEMLAEYRGKFQGGLIFAALGGIGGFFGFAIFFGFAGIIYNTFSYLFGGIRIQTR
ncbi:MAG: hypothetical protein ABFR36_01315 [Acidobacteriota bacterium]